MKAAGSMNDFEKVKRSTGHDSYQSEHLQIDMVIERLKKQGFRITRQRRLLIDIILGESCTCCKEVYILASKRDPGIGMATVYRTVDALEQAGALKRRTAYQLCDNGGQKGKGCLVELDDGSLLELDYSIIEKLIETEIHKSSRGKGNKVRSITWVHSD